jgi:hypothetical protein
MPFGFGSNFGGEKYAANGTTLRRYSGVGIDVDPLVRRDRHDSWSIRCWRPRTMTSR